MKKNLLNIVFIISACIWIWIIISTAAVILRIDGYNGMWNCWTLFCKAIEYRRQMGV